MTDSIESRGYAILREHPALLVSAFYVAASSVGMFWSWAYLRNFGVNVFNYAQISDFLLASLKEPFTWALVLLAAVMVLSDNAYSRRVEARGKTRWFRWYGSPNYRRVNNFAAILMVGVFIFAYATAESRHTKAGEGKIVDVVLAEGSHVQSATLLGTTGQFVFLYNPLTERVNIHPLESVHSISFQAN